MTHNLEKVRHCYDKANKRWTNTPLWKAYLWKHKYPVSNIWNTTLRKMAKRKVDPYIHTCVTAIPELTIHFIITPKLTAKQTGETSQVFCWRQCVMLSAEHVHICLVLCNFKGVFRRTTCNYTGHLRTRYSIPGIYTGSNEQQ